MDPNRNETFAALIVRKPGNLNILVRRQMIGHVMGQPHEWHVVEVRYSYTPLLLEDDDLRLTWVTVRSGDVSAVEDAISRLRETWGPLHVQDNVGVVPHLDQGRWQ